MSKISFTLLISKFAIRFSKMQSKIISKITKFLVLCMQLDMSELFPIFTFCNQAISG